MPADCRMRAVAQMRAHLSTCINCGFDLVAGRLGMADGDEYTAGGGATDEFRGPVVFRRDGCQLNSALGSFLQPPEFIPIGRPDVLPGMSASRAIVGTNERPFQMNAGNSRRDFG